MGTRREESVASAEQNARAWRRVRRNFWALVAATTVAVGVLSVALQRPSSVGTGLLVLGAGLAALAGIALAGRILVVTSRGRRRARRS